MGRGTGRRRRGAAARALPPPEPKGRKLTRDLVSLAFVATAIVAGIRAGRWTGDVGLAVGVGFAVCFVGGVLISRTLLAPDQRPAPRLAIGFALVTSPLVIAAGVLELRDDLHPVGELRLFCGIAGLLFGLEQWARRDFLVRRRRAVEMGAARAERDIQRIPIPAAPLRRTPLRHLRAVPDPAPDPGEVPDPDLLPPHRW